MKKLTKKPRKNPSGLEISINKLIDILEDLKVTISDPKSPFYKQDLSEANSGIRTLALKILEKI